MRLVLGILVVLNLLNADSFEEKMLKRGNQLQSIPNTFCKKEFGEKTWLFNLVSKNCPKKVGEKRTKCILKNRKSILKMWKDRDNELLTIARENNDKIVWIGRQTFYLDSLVESEIENKNSYSSHETIPKGYRLPTLKDITKACYDKKLRKYFYGATTGYNNDSFKTYFKYKNGGNKHIDFKTCKPVYLEKKKGFGNRYDYDGRDLVATKYIKALK